METTETEKKYNHKLGLYSDPISQLKVKNFLTNQDSNDKR